MTTQTNCDELERKKFEKWFEPRRIAMSKQGLWIISINRLKQRQWEAWQAALQSRQAER